MKTKDNNVAIGNIVKKAKIMNGNKYYELDIKLGYCNINMNSYPNNLIKIKAFFNEENYQNIFELKYFLNQSIFLSEIGVNNINELIKFFHTYFHDYLDANEYKGLINYSESNKKKIILEIKLFKNKIQIYIELFKEQYENQEKESLNNKMKINIRANPKAEIKNGDNSSAFMDYYISLINKKIILLQNLKKDNLNLVYQSSECKNGLNFHKICDKIGPTLILIDTEENRSFICFTSKSWNLMKINKEDENYMLRYWEKTNIKDENMSIIDLFSQKKIELKKNNENFVNLKYIQQYEEYGPSFVDGNGFTFKIFGKDKFLSIFFITKTIEEDNYIRVNYNLNKNNFFHVKDYKVYSISKIN